MSTFEVELKFRVPDPSRIRDQLAAWGVSPGPVELQTDLYFAHPQRNFAETDEAFRLRSIEHDSCLTYKGPVQDSRTKTRREIEVDLAPGPENRTRMSDLLIQLGFQPVRNVRKHRTPFRWEWQGRRWELALDEVEELGTFVEIETLATADDRAAASEAVLALAAAFGLDGPERKSYISLLLQQDDERAAAKA